MKCIVYDLENPPAESGGPHEFFCGVNGVFYRGNCGEVVDLPIEAINILNNCIIERTRWINKQYVTEKISRYMVKVLEPMPVEKTEAIPQQAQKEEPQPNEEGKFVCEVCGKDFNTKGALALHKRVHE